MTLEEAFWLAVFAALGFALFAPMGVA